MSDSDSENYSSEEDADYEPSDEDYSEDDVSELVKENLEDDDEQPQKKKSAKKPGKRISTRNRNMRSSECGDEGKGECEQDVDPEECAKMEKKKADDLWASFLSDVGQKAKPKATIPASTKEETSVEEKSNKHRDLVKDTEKLKSPGKVTITKVFDFAGEEVKITKEVDAASKEAKNFLQKQNNVEEKCSSTTPVSVATGAPTGSGLSATPGSGSTPALVLDSVNTGQDKIAAESTLPNKSTRTGRSLPITICFGKSSTTPIYKLKDKVG
ncbi:craniofacial development protein 1 isoform X3 [Mobula birostris]|uniref:craniofacial development protein 1 isoform X3 n=1 Tax=Mobula birostris TaxID=1983395 RepID=UPI003B27E771